jgi:hypothetical protein
MHTPQSPSLSLTTGVLNPTSDIVQAKEAFATVTGYKHCLPYEIWQEDDREESNGGVVDRKDKGGKKESDNDRGNTRGEEDLCGERGDKEVGTYY